jgi:hypothetical protein
VSTAQLGNVGVGAGWHGLGVSLEVYSISGVQQKIDAAKRLESEVIQ